MMIRGGNVRRRAGFGLIAAAAVSLAVGAGVTATGGRAWAAPVAQSTGSFSTISPPLTESAGVKNGLTTGLTINSGLYLGIAGGQTVVPPGIYSFDPSTLKLGKLLMKSPCGASTNDLVTDPATGDLLLTGTCGLWRISGIATANPVSTKLSGGDLDGLTINTAVTPEVYWVADLGVGGVTEFSDTGTAIKSFAIKGGADGLAMAGPNAAAGMVGNLFVNDNDGTITMVDLHNADLQTVVAAGGSRGDFVTVGPDGFLYATQSDRVEQIQPAVFVPIGTPPPTSTSSTSTSSSSPPPQTPSTHVTTTTTTTSRAAAAGKKTTTSSAATTSAPVTTPLPDTGANPLPWVVFSLLALTLGAFLVVRQRGSHE